MRAGNRPASKMAVLALLAALLALPLSGCFGIPTQPQVAATVNGDEILEDDVTDYIEGFRSKNDAYGTDSGWAGFLASAGYTPGSFRSYILSTNFIPKVLVDQECARRRIAVTDDQLDSVIEQERAYYEERYGEDSWDSVLASYGYDEESWRDNEEDRLQEEQLAREVVEDVKPKRSQIQSQANRHASDYNGKHSYYVAFGSLEAAQKARDSLKLKSGDKASFKAFKKLKAYGEVVNAGWSSLDADRDALSTEYLNALNGLDEKQVSEVVQIGEQHLLIYCREVYNVDAQAAYVKLEDIPKKIYRQLVADTKASLEERRFDDWLGQVTEDSKIVVATMPDGLPYDTDVSLTE